MTQRRLYPWLPFGSTKVGAWGTGMGQDVAGRVLLSVLGHMRRKGLDGRPVLAGMPFDLDALRSRNFRVGWGHFTEFWRRAEAALGGLAEMEQMGLDMIQTSLAMNLLGRLFVTPAHLYLQMTPRISRSFYPCIHVSTYRQEDGRLVFEGRLFGGQEMPLSFCAATQGLMRAYPHVLGLAEAQVESRYDTHAFRFCIAPPALTLPAGVLGPAAAAAAAADRGRGGLRTDGSGRIHGIARWPRAGL